MSIINRSVSKYIDKLHISPKDVSKAESILYEKKLKIYNILNKNDNYDIAHQEKLSGKGTKSSFFYSFAKSLLSITTKRYNSINKKELNNKLIKYQYYDRKIALKNEIFGRYKRTEEELGVTSLRPFFNAKEIAFQNIGILSNHINANSEWFSQIGIFRLSPQSSDLKEVLDIIDNTDGVKVNEELASIKKSNAICSALKKQLGLALTDSDKMKIFEFAMEYSKEKEHYIIPFIPSINKLPLPIQKIMPLFIKIIRHKDENKMSASNIAKMIAPYVTPTSKESAEDQGTVLAKTMQIIPFMTDLIDSEDFRDWRNSVGPLPKNPLQKSILSNT